METPSQIRDLHSQNSSLLAEIETLRSSNQILQSELTQKDELLHQIQLQKEDVLKQYVDVSEVIKEVSKERDTLRVAIQRLEDDFRRRGMEFYEETERIRIELEFSRKKAEELLDEKKKQSEICLHNLEIVQSAKHGLLRLVENLNLRVHRSGNSELKHEEKGEKTKLLNEKSPVFSVVLELVNLVDEKWGEYEEMRKKEKRELENSVACLEEENRDINSLLRIALVEKEAAEKSLNRLRGNTEQKKAAILQIAERGLQKVGFGLGLGFMMGSTATSETSSDNLDSDISVKSDNDECQTVAATLVTFLARSIYTYTWIL